MRKIITLFLLAAVTVNAEPRRSDTVSLRAPLDIPLTLAGNFGELRRNHFHSGVDFKTQGKTGLPIYAVDDGYVSRATVSPWGFGRALYITHPATGLTTVYGHLEAFSDAIDRRVRNKQYEEETFTIEVNFEPGEIPVKRGDLIAKSGNAGSSGGPHLHFDVRDTATGDALDPLEYYRNRVTDKVAPEPRLLALYPINGGIVNGSSSKGSYTQPVGTPSFTAWGDIVPGIKAYDRMSGTSNIYGIKYLTLTVDGDTIYQRVVDRFSFDDTRAVHTIVNNGDLNDKGEWIMTTRIPASDPLPYMTKAENRGIVTIDSTRQYNLVWILEDEHGNRKRVPFTINGKKELASSPIAQGELVLWNRGSTIQKDGLNIEIPANALYDNEFINIDTTPSTRYLSKIYTVGTPRIPLAESFTLSIPIDTDTLTDKSKYCLVRISGERRSAETANYTDGNMVAKLSQFGRYAVTTDKTDPVIQPIDKAKWRTTKNIKFKITDNLSGIDSWRGEIDGKFALFELDGKTSTLWFKIDETRFPGREHTVKLTVTDACGNTSTYSSKI